MQGAATVYEVRGAAQRTSPKAAATLRYGVVVRTAAGEAEPDDGSMDPPPLLRPARDGSSPRWLAASFVALAAIVVGAWLFLAIVHVDDRFLVDHVSGARMALARYAQDGTLYPPLYLDGFYGGTRFMPLPVVAHAALAQLTGDYLVSGRLLGYLTTVALVAATIMILRRVRCPLPLSLVLSVLILTTGAGVAASMNMRGDLLPLVLQLLAIRIVAGADRPGDTAVAAALSALALMSKLSAVWAPIAIVVWLFSRDRRRLGRYVITYVALVAGLFLVFSWISEGRIIENVLGLSTAGITGLRSVALAPYRFVHLIVEEGTAMWAVVPLAVVSAWHAIRRGAGSIWVVSTLCALGVTLVVLFDVGTGSNQLVDPIVLAAIVLGESVGETRADQRSGEGAATLVAALTGVTLLWVVGTSSVVTLAPPVLAAVQGEEAPSSDPLADIAGEGTSILSEDPYVPVSLGQTPVVLDPFMLPRLARRVPDAIPDLVRRIERREFDLVVLVEALEPLDRPWWSELELGRQVVHAIARSYVFSGYRDGYFVYEPGTGSRGLTSASPS
jgi:hypothetical protein